MKKIELLILTAIFAINAICQTPEKFAGKYLVNGIWTVIYGPGAGYNGSVEPRIVTVTTRNENIILNNFGGGETDSVLADVKLDSFFVSSHYYKFGECTSNIIGNGRFSKDTLTYQYFLGGTCLEDYLQFDCIGIKQKENSVNFIKNDQPIFKCFPNPISSEVFIQSSSDTEEAYTLEMYSVKGELVKTECLEPGSTLHRIDTSSLRNGVYILRLISDSGKYDEKVIVKE
jgi:hypothetical protein